MSLLLEPGALDGRRRVAAGGLAPLAASLAADIRPVLAARPGLPGEKARLSRAGGRCPADGAALAFDPFSSDRHRCPRCGVLFDGPAHYRSWLMWYQLWLAERALHAALLHLLVGDPECAQFADHVLADCAERYLEYPNRDNVLGPSRPFFSTYLESIWLLQIAVALDLREQSDTFATRLGAVLRERVVAPSAALIATYDEGDSNRQVWNVAALLAAARLLDDAAGVERAIEGPSGLLGRLRGGLLADGTWYEGDNYHQFAHRGLWYGVSLAERAGYSMPASLAARYEAGFATPFASALPDFTFPSRRDSQYAVSLRQWRFAEMAELGVARREDGQLLGALHELYEAAVPRGDPGRARSAAEAERNEPPSALTRADLGWRSLLFARETLPALRAREPRSLLLPSQGLAILRRDQGAVYAALDYGGAGGGHGHPDRLNVLLARGAVRWLDDPGTGSYVEPSLHWYRSTLAHNAPLVGGRSQERTGGRLRAYDERGGAGWVDAEAEIGGGVVARRALVVMPDYLVDELTWRASSGTTLDLPVHVDGDLRGAGQWLPEPLRGGSGMEDGFEFLESTERACDAAGDVRLAATAGGARAEVWLLSDPPAAWWRARAPGPPGREPRRFHLVRSTGTHGRIVSVWSWSRTVSAVSRAGSRLVVELVDGARHEHGRDGDLWRVGLFAGGAASSIDLAGAAVAGSGRATATLAVPAPSPPRRLVAAAAGDEAHSFVLRLGRSHYRRSEESWEEAGSPEAEVALRVGAGRLRIRVSVARSALRFAPSNAENDMDNEHPDVNGDGLQLYFGVAERVFGWRLVPEYGATEVRVGEVRGLADGPPLSAAWRPEGAGYLVTCELTLPAATSAGMTPFALELVVNETAAGRERRRGQLVLSGDAGEFVYLRGDRQPMDRALTFIVEPDTSRGDD